MIEFLNKLFGRQTSGSTAKERLRLVLMSDHLSLAPEMIDAMKRDLVEVISRYVEVDQTRIDVHFEHQDKALAMLANIPITGVARANGNGHSNGNGNGHANGTQTAAPVAVAQEELPISEAAAPDPAAPVANAQAAPASAHAGKPRTPRRKRKKGSSGSGSPATAS